MPEIRRRTTSVEPPTERPPLGATPRDALADTHGLPRTPDFAERASDLGLGAEAPDAETMLEPELGRISERPEDLASKAFGLLETRGLEASQLLLGRVRDRARALREMGAASSDVKLESTCGLRADAFERIANDLEARLTPCVRVRAEVEEALSPHLSAIIEHRLSESERSARAELEAKGPRADFAEEVLEEIAALRETLADEPRQAWRLQAAVEQLAAEFPDDRIAQALIRDIPRSIEHAREDRQRLIDVAGAAMLGVSFALPVTPLSAVLVAVPDVAHLWTTVDEWWFRDTAAQTEFDPTKPPLAEQSVSNLQLGLAMFSVGLAVFGVRAGFAARAEAKTLRAIREAEAPSGPLLTRGARELADWTMLLGVEGKLPSVAVQALTRPAFVAFAKQYPKEAKTLVDFWARFPAAQQQFPLSRVIDAFAPQGPQALRELAARLAATTTRSTFTKDGYEILERLATATDIYTPAVHIRPPAELDPNGAFFVSAAVQKASGGFEYVPTGLSTIGNIHPSQLLVDGRALHSMKEVLVFSAHGAPTGFANLSTRRAAEMIAEAIGKARAQGQTVSSVVLDACHQRDLRWVIGGSNAEALAKHLDRLLEPRVQVLASSQAGPLHGNFVSTRSFLSPRGPQDLRPAVFEAAELGAKLHLSPTQLAEMLLAFVAGVGVTTIAYGLTLHHASGGLSEDASKK